MDSMKSAGVFFAFVLQFLGIVLVNSEAMTDNGMVKKITAICGKDGIKVSVRFKQPFKGIVYSDGHYDTPQCVFIDMENNSSVATPQETRFSFLIPADECGTKFHDPGSSVSSNTEDGESVQITNTNDLANEVYMENTVMFQKNHFIQEQGDMAQTLRCVWQKEIRRPLHATLPLTIRGKERPQAGQSGKGKHETASVSSAFTKSPFPKEFQYLTASQQRHIDIRKRFQGKGQVQMVHGGNSGRSGKSLSFEEPTVYRRRLPQADLVTIRNDSAYSALPFKADDTSSASCVTHPNQMKRIFLFITIVVSVTFTLN